MKWFVVILAALTLVLTAPSVGAWSRHDARPVTAYAFQIVAANDADDDRAQWVAAYRANGATCEEAVRGTLIRADRDGWDIERPTAGLRAVAAMGGNRAPCTAALYLR